MSSDIIDIVSENNPEWWTGRLNGRQGIFPSNYVERLPPPQGPPPGPQGPAPVSYGEKPYPPPGTPGGYTPSYYSPPPGYPPPNVYQGPPPPQGPQGYAPYGGPPPPGPPAQQPVQTAPPQPQSEPPKQGGLGSSLGNTVRIDSLCLELHF
ncbi:hypothetical protein H0H81_006024 [Sphagnurus paluster]|uniref:SH3 domain-containing protein n=1 Tax=Sphagnurus paluster TaxID=117069 RepID=A0A9P7FRK4_9AGAR|nr:hypothetical protein H0H81_006024 [Sphagnurus paluster]